MNEPEKQHDMTVDEELVAYLDGELDQAAAARFEDRLAENADLQRKLDQHRRTWDFLDELPHASVGDRFTQTTVEMVAISIANHVDKASGHRSSRENVGWLIGSGVALLTSLAGYALIASILATPNRQLVEDLRVIENLDEYRAVEEIEFLRALEHEGLFVVEVDNEL